MPRWLAAGTEPIADRGVTRACSILVHLCVVRGFSLGRSGADFLGLLPVLMRYRSRPPGWIRLVTHHPFQRIRLYIPKSMRSASAKSISPCNPCPVFASCFNLGTTSPAVLGGSGKVVL